MKQSDTKPAIAPAGRPSALIDTRVIYCGDNLEQLAKLPPACVDLIYIDPPFNSNRNYEVFWGETKEKRSFEDRHASTQAYIDTMRPRCVELARVLKKTGSFYYHCDWHASHYVKVMLDQIFGENNFQNDIIWQRTPSHNDASQYGRNFDNIFFYTGSADHVWNPILQPYDAAYLDSKYRHRDEKGTYRLSDLTGAGTTDGDSSKPWRGFDPAAIGRHWAVPMVALKGVLPDTSVKDLTTQEKLDLLDKHGLIYWTPRKRKGDGGTGFPQYRRYLGGGMPLQAVWTDIPPINSMAQERLGYPTQKPLALLERIIKASSNPNDIVLDAFCGCGTALVAAQNLGRQWIGIDISPTACLVMAKRMRDICHIFEDKKLWLAGRGFVVRDLPWTSEKLRALPHFEFENWAVIALGGVPNTVQVGDMGIDGKIYPVGTKPSDQNDMFAGDWYPVQVKQMDKVGRPAVDQFEAVMAREDRQRGFFVAFGYSSDAEAECSAFHKKTGRIIKLITVQEILDEQHTQKM